MSKAIDEMRAYFNQPPVPPAGALLEHRKKVNRWLDEMETENDKLRKVVKQMHDCIKSSCNVCDECYCSLWDEDNECCVFDSYMREFRIA